MKTLVKMSPKMCKRGRPKDAGLTAIGLLKKKKTDKLTPFIKKSEWEKIKDIVLCVNCYSLVYMYSDECFDENVCIHLIRKYFTFDAWNQVKMVVDVLKDKGCWICRVCLQPLTGKSIACDSCLEWYHLQCIWFKKSPKKKT